jgi:hypothetical protein
MVAENVEENWEKSFLSLQKVRQQRRIIMGALQLWPSFAHAEGKGMQLDPYHCLTCANPNTYPQHLSLGLKYKRNRKY